MTDPEREDLHPLAAFGRHHELGGDTEVSAFFEISYGEYRLLKNGWSRPSWARAKRWEKRAESEFSATDVLEWHDRNERNTDAAEGAAG